MIEGGCLCGACRYSTDVEPLNVRVCHCHRCQKATGAAFYARVMVPLAGLTIDGSVGWVSADSGIRRGDGEGRHLAYGAVAGIGTKLSDALSTAFEYQLTHDHDPAGHATAQVAGISVGWQPADDLQLDVGANKGGNRHASEIELDLGVARRF